MAGRPEWRGLLHRLINLAPVKWVLTEYRSLTRRFFEWRYRTLDPYGGRERREKSKFSHAFAVLGEGSFRRGLDLGCGEGWHTGRVAARCARVDAVDLSTRAIARAREVNEHDNVEYRVLDFVSQPLPGRFDYIFCAETLYYLRRAQLDEVREKVLRALEEKGVLHLLHSRSLADDVSGLEYKAFGAKTIHDAFGRSDDLTVVADESRPMYRVTVYRMRPARAAPGGTPDSP